MKEVKKLIDLGKEKGYLTYDDVNDMLPAEVVSPDQIDDVMTIFGEMEIEVVDANEAIPRKFHVRYDIQRDRQSCGKYNHVDPTAGRGCGHAEARK